MISIWLESIRYLEQKSFAWKAENEQFLQQYNDLNPHKMIHVLPQKAKGYLMVAKMVNNPHKQ